VTSGSDVLRVAIMKWTELQRGITPLWDLKINKKTQTYLVFDSGFGCFSEF
jgi:hypothetical protein